MPLKFIHSGSTRLNLALTGHPLHGWPLGRMSNIIGDKSTGKTLLAIEAATIFMKRPPEGITDPWVVYHEAEAAFDIPYAEQLGMPVGDVLFEHAGTVEELHDSMKEQIEQAKKRGPHTGILYIVDSFDALSSKDEAESEIDAGSYGMAKQKVFGQVMRRLTRGMEEANLHLMIISQIRENISTLPYAPKWRRAGGKALDFYASHLVWLHETQKYKTGSGMVYGVNILAKTTKNKVARPFRDAEFPIIFEFGVDDIYSLLKWLSNEKIHSPDHRIRKKGGGYLQWQGEQLRLNDWVSAIEAEPALYRQLLQQADTAWAQLEDDATMHRVNKVDLLNAMDAEPEEEEYEEIEEEAEEDSEKTSGNMEEGTRERRFART